MPLKLKTDRSIMIYNKMEGALFPKEILKHIFTFVNTKDVGAFAATCKVCSQFAADIYKFTEECHYFNNSAIKLFSRNKCSVGRYGSINIQVKITYMKNIAANVKSPAAFDESILDILPNGVGRDFVYIDLSHYTNVLEVVIKDKQSEREDFVLKDIIIKVPQFCRCMNIKHFILFDILLVDANSGSKIIKIKSRQPVRIMGDVKFIKTFKVEDIMTGHYYMNAGDIFKLCDKCETINTTIAEPTNNTEIIQNNNIKKFRIGSFDNINFILKCPNLRELIINLKELETFIKKNRDNILPKSAKLLLETFKCCPKLKVVNVKHYCSPMPEVNIKSISGYLEDSGFRYIYFRRNTVLSYGRYIVDIIPTRHIAAICGNIYIHKHILSQYLLDYIEFVIDMLDVQTKFYEDIEELTINFRGKEYKINEEDADQFSIERVAAYFKYNGYRNKYELREYFPFV